MNKKTGSLPKDVELNEVRWSYLSAALWSLDFIWTRCQLARGLAVVRGASRRCARSQNDLCGDKIWNILLIIIIMCIQVDGLISNQLESLL